ncbi:hypothetical protein F5Y12DRAFT_716378 [Xylaria sp. FL1777]|nr:hypothetical protein F5Y12DRAFT_716378 [Xylaria sp. FL1777]
MSSSTKVDVTFVSDEDIPECFRIVSESFGHNEVFVDSYFPNHATPSGRVQGSNRLMTWKNTSPESVFLKAVVSVEESATVKEQVVGLAVWTHMKDIPPEKLEEAENAEEFWPDLNDRKFMAALWKDYVKLRSQAVRDSRGNGVYVLELLAVHPDYQRLGAGTALVSWGIKASDKAQVKAVVEGTKVGRRLYEKCGFSAEIEEMLFDTGGEFAERAKPELIFLTREPDSS